MTEPKLTDMYAGFLWWERGDGLGHRAIEHSDVALCGADVDRTELTNRRSNRMCPICRSHCRAIFRGEDPDPRIQTTPAKRTIEAIFAEIRLELAARNAG